MPRLKRSRVAKKLNLLKRRQSPVNNISELQPAAATARVQSTSFLETSMVEENNDTSVAYNYIIVDCDNLTRLFTNLLCSSCHSATLNLHFGQRNGFAHKLNVVCTTCEETNSKICSSKQLLRKKVSNDANERQILNSPFDVNIRLVQGILSLGLGYSALEKFCMQMNLNIMSSKTFKFYKTKVLDGHLLAANELMSNIHKNVKKAYGSKQDIVDIGVSHDGSWLTRGHTSNIGISCVIDLLTGFVIDYEVLSKRCEECEQTKLALGTDSPEFHIWFEGHREVCSITHVGSSGSMEVKAAVKLWERSESIGFRYTTLLSDGDSKAFLELQERKVYGSEVKIEKEECINHVSKRLGTALREVVKEWRKKGVTLGGKKHGSLKEETIKKLTRYYANAIRKNTGNAEAKNIL